ncbi:Hypothetical predicted protein [Scomber scombrus]|uniref:Uncharacterized protein n=1 Tax=Scomber scombrus TaxID=13677 RepID=A0AAV1N7M5_SCOSC
MSSSSSTAADRADVELGVTALLFLGLRGTSRRFYGCGFKRDKSQRWEKNAQGQYRLKISTTKRYQTSKDKYHLKSVYERVCVQ